MPLVSSTIICPSARTIRMVVSLNISTRLPGAINDGTRLPMATIISTITAPSSASRCFKSELSIYAASCFAPLAALTMVSAVASPAWYSATISPSCMTIMRSAMPITSGSSDETIITASP